MNLAERLHSYIASRSDAVNAHDADVIVTRVLARGATRSAWSRHSLNLAAAVALSLLILVGGVAFGMQLRSLRFGTAAPTTGPLPIVPNEIINLDSERQDSTLITPFRLRDHKVLAARPRVILSTGAALLLYPSSQCDSTTIHIVDSASPAHDVRPPVTLPGCYPSASAVPNSNLLLLDHEVGAGNGAVASAGIVAYDWSAGRIVQTYPNVQSGFEGGLLSAEATRFYTIASGSQGMTLNIIDLTNGANVAQIELQDFGLNGGGIALSPDGQTLYLNEGIWLRTFDARTGKEGPKLDFKDPKQSPVAMLPGRLASWLFGSIDVEAKEGFEIGHGVAVDPKGEWVAALGVDDNTDWQGVWVFDTKSGRLLRHVLPSLGSTHFRGLAVSLDGSALYALEVGSRQVAIDVIDPNTGRVRSIADARLAGSMGIAGVAQAP